MRRRTKPEGGRFSFTYKGEEISRPTEGQILNLAQRRAELETSPITFTVREWNDAVYLVSRDEDGAVVTQPFVR